MGEQLAGRGGEILRPPTGRFYNTEKVHRELKTRFFLTADRTQLQVANTFDLALLVRGRFGNDGVDDVVKKLTYGYVSPPVFAMPQVLATTNPDIPSSRAKGFCLPIKCVDFGQTVFAAFPNVIDVFTNLKALDKDGQRLLLSPVGVSATDFTAYNRLEEPLPGIFYTAICFYVSSMLYKGVTPKLTTSYLHRIDRKWNPGVATTLEANHLEAWLRAAQALERVSQAAAKPYKSAFESSPRR